MFWHKMLYMMLCLTLSAIFIPSSPSLAQDSEVVTAEVMVDTLMPPPPHHSPQPLCD